jgi:ureidoglycolate lyase
LTPEPLTKEAFAPFGEVIEAQGTPREINEGLTKRFHDLARIEVGGARAIVSIFRTEPLPLPLTLKTMENHPLGSQAFMPLSGRPYLVVVAPAGRFEANGLKAFFASPIQGVNIRRGVWHHFNLALIAQSDFLVIDREDPDKTPELASSGNLEEIAMSETIRVALPESLA